MAKQMNEILLKILIKYKSSDYWFPTIMYFLFVAGICSINAQSDLPTLVIISSILYGIMCLLKCTNEEQSSTLWKLYTSDILSLFFHRQDVQYDPNQIEKIKSWCENNLNHKYFYFDRNLFITNSNDLMAYKLKWHQQS